MRKNKQIIYGVIAAIGMMILILDSSTAITGGRDGIVLCLTTVIPSIFPFLVLSKILTTALAAARIPLLNKIGQLCHIQPGCEGLLLVGLLGGYPVGAQCIQGAYKNGQLSRSCAQRLLAFCNNAGPAFIFGMTSQMFTSRQIPLLIWLIHILSAVFVGMIIPVTNNDNNCTDKIGIPEEKVSIEHCVRTMGIICGWIVLFRIIISFLQRWFMWGIPNAVAVVIQGLLELSNGCVALPDVQDEGIRFVLCSGLLAFGGVCVWMQTVSVATGLSTKYYLLGKVLQTLISCGLSTVLLPLLFPNDNKRFVTTLMLIICAICSLMMVYILKKSSSNREKSVV